MAPTVTPDNRGDRPGVQPQQTVKVEIATPPAEVAERPGLDPDTDIAVARRRAGKICPDSRLPR